MLPKVTHFHFRSTIGMLYICFLYLFYFLPIFSCFESSCSVDLIGIVFLLRNRGMLMEVYVVEKDVRR